MYVMVLTIFMLKVQSSVSQFPNHMDFQKVGEVIFNNEHYNVLKPTTHVISDYFKEFMLRRDNNNFPTKRVFIDDNGFRHFWSGFGKQINSLRKTDDIDTNLISNSDNVTKANVNTNGTSSTTDVTASNQNMTINDTYDYRTKQSNEVSKNGEENANERNITVDKIGKEGDSEILETTTFFPALEKRTLTTKIIYEERLREGEKSKNTIRDDDKDNGSKEGKKDDSSDTDDSGKKKKSKDKTKKDSKDTADRVVAKTTFFCPFFGVITMAAFID